ncbi:flagellar motor protein MotD [Niveibacterium sp. 24ML]|uniref:flagellar motor protein MotD n=1 Tax=Niveibacterium sp. 24ML TaxID=2985512 RepID=UPI0022702A1A|nr:flagellar motor protein MotD [Niveibacterium sp. 24ML]MCX9157963.1 flagellar motor protein MotD [Niveibacterium sp. 24ML]
MAGRRKHEEEHENHERWLVSYADFITLLFAFFVVMYALSSINEGKYRVLSNSLVSAFRSVSTNADGMQIVPRASIAGAVPQQSKVQKAMPDETPARAQARQQMKSMAEQVRRVLEPLVRGGQVTVNEGVHGISIEINASALFNPGEALLGAEAYAALSAVGSVVAQGDFPIRVEGHTDNIPIANSAFASNWELSAVRASSVVRLFIDAGVDARRMTVAGYADQRPVADNSTADGRLRNRRVSIHVESMLPPVAEGPTVGPVTPSSGGGALGATLPE